jgi:hypothetical protein
VRKRRLLVTAVVGAGSFAGTMLYRRRTERNRTRVDLYFDDGSMVSLASGSPDAERILPLAGEALAAAGGA